MRKLLCMVLAVVMVLGVCALVQAEEERVEISVMTWAGGGQKTADEANRDLFNASQDRIHVTYEFVPTDYNAKLNTLIAADQAPDIYFLNNADMVNQGFRDGKIADMTEYYSNWGAGMDPDSFIPNAIFIYGDKILGVTPGVEVFLIYYNRDLVAEAGVTMPTDGLKPWTWDEYVAAAKRLTVDKNGVRGDEEGFDPGAGGMNVKTFGTAAPSWTMAMQTLLRSNSENLDCYASLDGTKLTATEPFALEVFQSVADLIHVHKVSPTQAMLEAFNMGNVALLMNGQLAMYISGTWEMASFGDENYNVGLAPVPMFKQPANIIWGAPVVVSEQCANKQEAADYMKFYVDPNFGIGPSADGSWMPSLKDWFVDADKKAAWQDNPRHPEEFNNFIGDIAISVARPPEDYTLKNYNEIVADIIQPALDQLWLGDVATAAEAMEGVAEQVESEGLLQGAW